MMKLNVIYLVSIILLASCARAPIDNGPKLPKELIVSKNLSNKENSAKWRSTAEGLVTGDRLWIDDQYIELGKYLAEGSSAKLFFIKGSNKKQLIKITKDPIFNDSAVHALSLKTEWESISKLKKANIPSVNLLTRSPHYYFVTMEFIPGLTLRKFIRTFTPSKENIDILIRYLKFTDFLKEKKANLSDGHAGNIMYNKNSKSWIIIDPGKVHFKRYYNRFDIEFEVNRDARFLKIFISSWMKYKKKDQTEMFQMIMSFLEDGEDKLSESIVKFALEKSSDPTIRKVKKNVFNSFIWAPNFGESFEVTDEMFLFKIIDIDPEASTLNDILPYLKKNANNCRNLQALNLLKKNMNLILRKEIKTALEAGCRL
jgi:hypothetical protein